MNATLWNDALLVMIIGMGTVFVLLTVMIWAMDFNGKVLKFVNKIWPEEVPEAAKPARRAAQTSDDEEVALAIACAMAKAGKHAV